jgi:hypothetical protein
MMTRASMTKQIEPWNSPSPKKRGTKLKGKKGYGSAKAAADKKFGKKTSLVKNMYISKKMKRI